MSRHEIVSPLPGVFYRHPDPGSPPFANEGDTVDAGQTIGLIEVMKQFNEVKSTVSGVLESFVAEDRSEVEPGGVIAYIEEQQ